MSYPSFILILRLLVFILITQISWAQPIKVIDLANTSTSNGTLLRVYGSTGNGSSGLPVAGGFDTNGDGFKDYAMAAMLASPLGRTGAGEVYLVFGNGAINGTVDTSQNQSRILKILGAAQREHAGSEIWMDDVTGDGLGDLLICRQDHTPASGPVGAGALTIIKGGAELQTFANGLTALDLAAPPVSITTTTIVGATTQDRLCIWLRTGDISGDGIADIVVGADQAGPGAEHHGELYIIRGGAHLAVTQTINLASFGTATPPLNGNLLRINAPANASHYHLGATVQVGDLDANNRAEVMAAAALNRAGAGLTPFGTTETVHASGGTTDGTLYVIWDDNIPAGNWPANFQMTLDNLPGTQTTINGSNNHESFGEEILGGLDYDNDGNADLFSGDLTGSPTAQRSRAGLGDVLFNAATLKNQNIDLDNPPAGLVRTQFYGPRAGAISADTAMHGDFNGDGISDLAFSSPHDSPFNRSNAGTLHVFFGKTGGWPALVDLQPGLLPSSSQIEIVEIYGANGNATGDVGDTLSYSGAFGDINDDDITDIITNEMVGNGIAPNTIDVGNLIIISGAALVIPLFIDQFESP